MINKVYLCDLLSPRKKISKYEIYLKGMTLFINVTIFILPDIIKINMLTCKRKM